MPPTLDLALLRGNREHIERRLDASLFEASRDDFTVEGEAELILDVEKDGAQYHLVGCLRALLTLPCSRCLEPMAWPVDMPVDVRYSPLAGAADRGEHEIGSDDLTVAFFENEQIDLGELVREQLYLTVPMKPLCKPDCQGLCTECGANRNVVACTCEHRWVDPRLEALKELLPKAGRKT
ncbi:MAG: DUF177 domain-containing protein [Vicinamibacterales bacterium]